MANSRPLLRGDELRLGQASRHRKFRNVGTDNAMHFPGFHPDAAKM